MPTYFLTMLNLLYKCMDTLTVICNLSIHQEFGLKYKFWKNCSGWEIQLEERQINEGFKLMKGKSFGCGPGWYKGRRKGSGGSQVNVREEESGQVDRREKVGEAVEGDSHISFTVWTSSKHCESGTWEVFFLNTQSSTHW